MALKLMLSFDSKHFFRHIFKPFKPYFIAIDELCPSNIIVDNLFNKSSKVGNSGQIRKMTQNIKIVLNFTNNFINKNNIYPDMKRWNSFEAKNY